MTASSSSPAVGGAGAVGARPPRSRLIAAGLTALAILGVYLFALSPDIAIGDGPELITAATTLGIPHPPGYPLFCLAMHFLARLPGVSPAFGVNLGTAFFGALASFIFLLIAAGPGGLPLAMAVPLTLIHGLTPTLWGQSVVAEVYALSLALLLLVCLLHLSGKGKSGLLPYLSGLTLTAHTGNLLVLLPVAWARRPALRRRPGRAALAAGLFVLGLSPFLYVWLRSIANPLLDWGRPNEFATFLRHISREQYGGFRWAGAGAALKLLGYWLRAATGAGSLLAWPLAAWALFRGWRNGVTRTLAAWLLLSGPVAALLLSGLLRGEQLVEPDVFLLPSFSFLLLLAGCGLADLPWIGRAARLAAVPLAGWAVWLLISGYPVNNKAGNWIALDYGRALLSSLPQQTILFVNADHEGFPAMYLQAVLGERRDVTLRRIPPPFERDLYGYPAPAIRDLRAAGERPVFVTLPRPPFDPEACVPQELAFRVGPGGPPVTTPWTPPRIRYRSSARLSYFERLALAGVSFHHAAVLFPSGDEESALREVDRAAALATDNPGMLTGLGSLLANHDFPDRATRLWNRALVLDGTWVPAWEALVTLRLEQGDVAGARALLRQALAAAPGAPSLREMEPQIDGPQPAR